MKEPPQGTRNSPGEEIVHAVGQSQLGIIRSGRVDGIQCLPQMWQKVVHMGAIILKECVFISGNKVFSELQRYCH
jgi:hypothetical protein